jgi:hypothetical protein
LVKKCRSAPKTPAITQNRPIRAASRGDARLPDGGQLRGLALLALGRLPNAGVTAGNATTNTTMLRPK